MYECLAAPHYACSCLLSFDSIWPAFEYFSLGSIWTVEHLDDAHSDAFVRGSQHRCTLLLRHTHQHFAHLLKILQMPAEEQSERFRPQHTPAQYSHVPLTAHLLTSTFLCSLLA